MTDKLRFLLVAFQIDYIISQPSTKLMRRALSTIPTGLYGTFTEATKKTNRQEDGNKGLALSVLRWIVKASRPLRITELLEAVAVEGGDKGLSEDGLPSKTTVIDVCAGLVTVDEISQVVRLTH